MFIMEQLAIHAKVQPEKVITSYQGRNTSYARFYQQAKNLAGYFQMKGYQKNDIIAVYLHNSDSFLICYYACQLGGFTVMPVNTKLTAPEVEYIFTHSEAKAIIYDIRLDAVLNQLGPVFEKFENQLVVGGEDTLAAIFSNDSIPFTQVSIDEEDIAVVFYTSGTTGKPKGVMLTAKNVRAVAQIWSEAMNITSEDRMHIVAPLFHCAASHVFSIPTIYKGGRLSSKKHFLPKKH